MPATRRVAKRRTRSTVTASSFCAYLDAGNRIPSGPERLWPLLDALQEADPAHSWHDPLALLSASGDRLADHITPPTSPEGAR